MNNESAERRQAAWEKACGLNTARTNRTQGQGSIGIYMLWTAATVHDCFLNWTTFRLLLFPS